ncbi:PPOX class F420-dependent oxidoreductase [Micromonosporaceae bacterium Da 78-11]
MTVSLPEAVQKLLDNPTFAVVSTINADTTPQSTVIWVKRDGDDVLFSTVRGRRKTRNMERDPRISICAYDPDQPYYYFTVEGTVTLTEEGGHELIDELSHKYDDRPYTFDTPGTVRVVCRLTPTRVISR